MNGTICIPNAFSTNRPLFANKGEATLVGGVHVFDIQFRPGREKMEGGKYPTGSTFLSIYYAVITINNYIEIVFPVIVKSGWKKTVRWWRDQKGNIKKYYCSQVGSTIIMENAGTCTLLTKINPKGKRSL